MTENKKKIKKERGEKKKRERERGENKPK